MEELTIVDKGLGIYDSCTDDNLIAFSLEFKELKGSYCTGVFIKDINTISIHMIDAPNMMKHFMNHLVKKFNTSKIMFCTPMNGNLEKALKGFKRKTEMFEELGEACELLVGEWKVNEEDLMEHYRKPKVSDIPNDLRD